jgi:hypothetical protein
MPPYMRSSASPSRLTISKGCTIGHAIRHTIASEDDISSKEYDMASLIRISKVGDFACHVSAASNNGCTYILSTRRMVTKLIRHNFRTMLTFFGSMSKSAIKIRIIS